MKLLPRILALAGFAFGLASAAHAQTKIAVGYTAVADYVQLFAAKEEGFFAKRGLDVEPTLVTLNSTIPQALLANSLQVGLPTPSVFLQAVDGGLDLVILGGTTVTDPSTSKNFGVVVRTGENIKTAQDFVGKKVGVPGIGAFLHVLFRQWLIEKGVDPKKVTYIEVSFPQMNDVLKGGTVDAVVSAVPIMTRIVAAGNGYIIPYADDLPAGQSVTFYAATREWASKNANAVKAFREAIAEGANFVKANPDKAHEYIAKYTKLPLEIVRTITLGVQAPVATEAQVKWWVTAMKQQDMLRTSVDTSKVIWQ
jgi:NitT/TauT family transport system substrate-binding protein